MGAQIEIKLRGMGDANIDSGSGWYISWTSWLFFWLSTEKTGVVAFLHHNESDSRLVVWL